ncbi:hypothetical protein C2845_PM09G03790 [Panicum miliaceum]|uniref:Uncharacterized protein n=1 Tax=Panicum miliaceum TaxID=4540 RepID=A0A3L6S3M7_PANMI|nr:hypothetical protein C2845_PM09G03790 [Panicum miliaceum]
MDSTAAAGEADRISGLDDDVLLGVLGMVADVRDAARTAALSRRWVGLWTRAPALRFASRPVPREPDEYEDGDEEDDDRHRDDDGEKGSGADQQPLVIIDELLPSPARLETMHLALGDAGLRLPTTMKFASLTDLSLESIKIARGGAHLLARLVSPANCPRLQKLRMINLRLFPYHDMQLDADVLSELWVEGVNVRSLELRTPSLRVLHIDTCCNKLLRVSAPRLEELTFFQLGRPPSRLEVDGRKTGSDLWAADTVAAPLARRLDLGAWRGGRSKAWVLTGGGTAASSATENTSVAARFEAGVEEQAHVLDWFRVSGVWRSPGSGRRRRNTSRSVTAAWRSACSRSQFVQAAAAHVHDGAGGREEVTALDAWPCLAPRPAHGVEANEVAGAVQVQVPVSARCSRMVAAAYAAVHAASSLRTGAAGKLRAALELLARWTGTSKSKMPIFFFLINCKMSISSVHDQLSSVSSKGTAGSASCEESGEGSCHPRQS